MFDPALPDEVLEVASEEAFATARCLARQEGLLVGVSAAANVAAAIRVARRLRTGTVVTILCDSAAKYLSERFWDEDADAFDTLWTVLEVVCRVTAPLMPLTTEEVWRGLTGERSVHLADWPDAASLPSDRSLVEAQVAEARAQLRAGNLGAAAAGFRAMLRAAPGGSYSIQLLIACAPETIAKAVAGAGGPELFVVPIRYQGRDCHRVCWGLYDGRARADSALRSVPAYFREGGNKPKVMAASELLQ